MGWKRHIPVLALAGGVILIQLLTAAFRANYYLTQLTMSAYYGLVIIGLSLLLGYCGQISIGQAGFFAMGGYTTAFLTNLIWNTRGERQGLPPSPVGQTQPGIPVIPRGPQRPLQRRHSSSVSA